MEIGGGASCVAEDPCLLLFEPVQLARRGLPFEKIPTKRAGCRMSRPVWFWVVLSRLESIPPARPLTVYKATSRTLCDMEIGGGASCAAGYVSLLLVAGPV